LTALQTPHASEPQAEIVARAAAGEFRVIRRDGDAIHSAEPDGVMHRLLRRREPKPGTPSGEEPVSGDRSRVDVSSASTPVSYERP
jgi:hypothetical protein